MADHADVLEARQEKQQAEDVKTEVAVRHAAVWRQLAALVGQPDLPPCPLSADPEGPGPDLTFEPALAHLLEASPEPGARGRVAHVPQNVRYPHSSAGGSRYLAGAAESYGNARAASRSCSNDRSSRSSAADKASSTR